MARTRASKNRKISKSTRTPAKSASARSAAAARGTAGAGAARGTAGAARGAAGAARGTAGAGTRGAGGGNEGQLKKELDELYRQLVSSSRPWTLRRARHEFERSYVEYVIRQNAGDRQSAAERLDIGFSTLKEKIRKP